jgi:phage shock protein E
MRTMGGAGLGIVLLMAGVALVRGAQHSTDTLEQVKARLQEKKAMLIDVREKGEWNRGHLEGARLISLSSLMEWERDGLNPAQRAQLEKAIPKGTILYCHCASGGRSVPAGEALRKIGFDARALREGYRDLLAAGFPKSAK